MYGCDFCPVNVENPEVLAEHVRSHHGERRRTLKPQCPHCFSTFANWSAAKVHVKHCPAVSWGSRRNKHMGKTISGMKEERGIGGPPMLKGSKVKGSTVKIKVKALREAPRNFGSPAIIDFDEEVNGAMAWAVNMTNLRALAAMFGFKDNPDDADFDVLAKKLAGKTLTLHVEVVNDPKRNQMVRSLFLEAQE